MTAEESWASAMRAEALAKLLLTERDDLDVLQVSQTSPRIGYDLLVRVHGTEVSPAPEFAVEVRGTRKRLDSGTLAQIVRNQLARNADADLPICLFVFQVDARAGYYRWLYEPIVRDAEHAELVKAIEPFGAMGDGAQQVAQSPQVIGLEELNKHAIDRIVDQVVRWSRHRGRVLVR
jgi:hypothetical protein